MSVARSTLAGGPAHITVSSADIHLLDDAKLELAPSTQDIETSMYGVVDETVEDLVIKASGTPLEYANLAVLFPYLTFVKGQRIFGNADVPLVYKSNNGDVITLKATALTKMPSLFLGVDKPILGDAEWTAVLADGANPEDASSYFTIQTAQTYTPVAVTKGNIKRQRYSAVWTGIAGFTAFQAQDGWTIDFELKLEPVKIQARTVDMKIMNVRCMAKCMPQGPTMAQIDTALKQQGTGADAGHRLGASVADLVITGSGVSATIKNAALKTAGFVFGGKPLRIGELGWVSTLVVSTGTATAVAVIA